MKTRVFILLISLVMCLKFSIADFESDWLEDLQSGKTIDISNGVEVKLEGLSDSVNKTSNFSSPILRAFLEDVEISFAEKGDSGLQIGLFTTNFEGGSQARGSDSKVFSVVLPLLIGFKIAGSILVTLVAVLIVSIKAFLASIVSLLLTGAGAIKQMMMKHDPIPADLHYPMEYYGHPAPTGYEYPSAHGYHASLHDDPPHSAPSAPDHDDDSDPHDHEDHSHEEHHHEITGHTGPSASAESKVNEQYSAKNATKGVKRRGYKKRDRVKRPILTVAKITRREDY